MSEQNTLVKNKIWVTGVIPILKITGSATHELQLRFLMDWRASSNEELLIDDDNLSQYLPAIAPKNGCGIQIVSSSQIKLINRLSNGALDYQRPKVC